LACMAAEALAGCAIGTRSAARAVYGGGRQILDFDGGWELLSPSSRPSSSAGAWSSFRRFVGSSNCLFNELYRKLRYCHARLGSLLDYGPCSR
jgi:hypothetical protein